MCAGLSARGAYRYVLQESTRIGAIWKWVAAEVRLSQVELCSLAECKRTGMSPIAAAVKEVRRGSQHMVKMKPSLGSYRFFRRSRESPGKSFLRRQDLFRAGQVIAGPEYRLQRSKRAPSTRKAMAPMRCPRRVHLLLAKLLEVTEEESLVCFLIGPPILAP